MTDHTWVAGLVYNPLPGRTSPRRRFIKSPFPPQTPTGGGTPTSLASPLPSPPITPNSTTPPPPRRVTPPVTRPKSRTALLRARGHDRQGSIDGVVSASVAIPTRLGGHERTGSSGSGIAPQTQTQTGSSPPATGSSPAGEGLTSPRSVHQQPTSPATGSPQLASPGTSTPHGNAGNPKRIMLRELLPRVLATPALENAPEDLGRFARLQTLALHIFQDPCAFDTDDLSRFLAAPLSPPALRAFSDTVLEAWGRSAPAAIRIPPNTPIRIVDPHSDLSALDASPLELCSAATCACLLWTNMFPERYLAISRSSHSRGGGALDLSAEVRPAPLSIGLEDIESATIGSAFTSGAAASGAAYSVGMTRSGMSVTMFKARVPIGLGDNVAARIRQSLQPWQKASHSALMPLLGVTMGGTANKDMIVCPPGGTGWPVALPSTPGSDSDISLVYAGPPRTRLGLAMPTATSDAYRMLRALAKALRYLHQLRPALVHGGVRPDTILLTPSGDPALSESGLAKIIEDLAVGGGATDAAGVPGSPGNASSSTTRPMPPGALRYTAPELFGENRALARRTTRSDVYAFGCVVYEVFTGEVPFFDVPENRVPRALYDGQTLKRPTASNATQFPHALPLNDELWTLITRCCAFDLSRRPTMAQVVGMLNVARSADNAGPGAMVHVAQPAGASNSGGAGNGGGQAELMEWLLGVVPGQSPTSPSAAPAQSYPMGGVGAALEPAAIMALVESASKVAQASPPVLVN